MYEHLQGTNSVKYIRNNDPHEIIYTCVPIMAIWNIYIYKSFMSYMYNVHVTSFSGSIGLSEFAVLW